MEALAKEDIRPNPPPAGAAPDWTIPQRWEDYSTAEHAIWNVLFRRQLAQLQDRAVQAFLEGVRALGLAPNGIPRFEDLNKVLQRRTGWSVVAVPGLVPEEVFFRHLANRQFVAGRFIRKAAQLDYLQEPDVFHDVFGHVPLLADPVYAGYMQAYGEAGTRLGHGEALVKLARLYWYTVEFGLVRDGERLKLFGAGIVSSNGESAYALDSPEPLRLGFDLQRVMLTDYKIDAFQRNYFVIDSFEDLVRRTAHVDFGRLCKELEGIAPIAVGTRLPTDVLFGPNQPG
jgi:phenylalanine-4-hydroxylase